MTTALSLALAGGLLGDARKSLAACQLGPDGLGFHAERRQQGQQMVEHVGAFAHELRPVAADAFDQRLDGFLAQLFGDLLAAAAEQAGRVGSVGVGALVPPDRGGEADARPALRNRRHAPWRLSGLLLLGLLVSSTRPLVPLAPAAPPSTLLHSPVPS